MHGFRFGTIFVAGLLVAAFFGGTGMALEDCPPDLEKPIGLQAKVKHIRREINLHNLYNGLHLTIDQMEKILVLARKASRLREATFGEENPRCMEIVSAYEEILRHVREGRRIPKTAEGMGTLMEFAEKRILKRFFREMEALEGEVWSVLTPAQRDIFKTYEPCLIPPKSLRDPVRVGQAKDNEAAKNILVSARQLPEAEFEGECRRLLSLHLSILERFLGKMEHGVREKEIDRMVSVCRRARSLSEVDFAMKADALAQELSLDAPKNHFKDKAEEFLHLIRKFQGGSISGTPRRRHRRTWRK
ncbi:MAG: hypothetical protein ACYTHN_12450 [Planctomycetota bacterium]